MAFFFSLTVFAISLGRNGPITLHSSDGLSSLATWGDESLSNAEFDLPCIKAGSYLEVLSRAGFMQLLNWFV